jgi:hypothetical protein
METPKTEQHRQVTAEMREARAKASDHRMTRAEFVAQSTTESATPETDAAITPKPVRLNAVSAISARGPILPPCFTLNTDERAEINSSIPPHFPS